jgi:structure-specific recognition protein 1
LGTSRTRQGKTFYAHVLLQFPGDETTEVSLELDEETLKTKYDGKLQVCMVVQRW